jgi:hypothetical protein
MADTRGKKQNGKTFSSFPVSIAAAPKSNGNPKKKGKKKKAGNYFNALV